eukprot:GHVT01047551.1.p1 GENE.GHVT01047551.1~~GHVT01047551.1.p1  ORF type:complete len:366 (+),score=79.17 GHVT01047551.1:203-1300(+)
MALLDSELSRREAAPGGVTADLAVGAARKGTAPSETEKRKAQDERLKLYCENFAVEVPELKRLAASFQDQLVKGLEMHKRCADKWSPAESDFKMLDSFITQIPTGKETGVFYSFDFGGTKARAVLVELADGKVKRHTDDSTLLHTEGPPGLPKGLLSGEATASDLFSLFARKIKRIIEGPPASAEPTPPVALGFTCSFPCIQKSLSSSELVEWTKDFETGEKTNDKVVGRDVGQLLTQALRQHSVKAELMAVLNDTVGTLISCAYHKSSASPPCRVGMILGTGSNACYYEPRAQEFGYTGNVVNIEFGNFQQGQPCTNIDFELDFFSANRGRQLFEKLISGAYLGEMVRKATVAVLAERTPAAAW